MQVVDQGQMEENISNAGDVKEKISRRSQACESAKCRGYTRLLGSTTSWMPARLVVLVALVLLSKRESSGGQPTRVLMVLTTCLFKHRRASFPGEPNLELALT
jgi:hypothetical protein